MDLSIVGDVATFTITGDVDAHNEEQLRHTLWEAAHADPTRLVVDLSEAGMFGSTGVNGLIWTWQLLLGTPTTILVTGCSPLTARVLDICGVSELGISVGASA